MTKQNMRNILFTGLIFLCLTKPAYAYLDPGTGSYVFQLLVAGFLASSFFFRSFIKKIIRKIKGKDMQKHKDEAL